MPLTVSRWPQFPDPRPPLFGARGAEPETAAPWQWWINTTGATGDYTPFNTGVMLTVTFWDDGEIFWDAFDFPGVGYHTNLTCSMWETTDPPTRPYTLAYQLEVRLLGILRWVDRQQYTYPDNVTALHTMQASLTSIDRLLMPDPMSIRPRAYQLGPP